MLLLLGLLGILTSAFAIIMPIYFARITDNYSPWSNTLSELGATGSPHQKAVAWYYFLPLSIAIMVFVILGPSVITFVTQDRLVWGLLGLVGAGYWVAAVFPCDHGAPMMGSVSNKIHNVAGLLEYLGAGFGLILMGVEPLNHSTLPQISVYLILSGSVILLSLVMMILPPFTSIKGLVQRLAEASFFTWMLTVSLLLLFSDR